jgi:hypothetical protein
MTDADTQEEFVKSYADGFFGVKIDGKVYPSRVVKDRVTKRTVLPIRYMCDKEGKELSMDVDWVAGRGTILRGYPDLGCIKVGPTLAYLSVRPLRQYKKGYVPDNVLLHIPNQYQIRKVLPRFIATSSSKEVVWQVFNREYWELAAAVALLDKSEGVGYPLSQNFGIYLHSDHPNPIILCKNHDAGVYKDGKVELFKNFGVWKEQFQRETGVEANVCR